MALLFDGTQNVAMGFSRPFAQNVAGCTVMGWGRLESATANRSIVGFFNNASNTRCKINVNTDLTISLRGISLDADATSAFNSTGTISPFIWQHVAGVIFYSNKNGVIYINGVPDTFGIFTNMTAGNTSNTASSVGRFGSGEAGTNNRWLGSLEDIRVYNRALGPDEIATIYSAKGHDGIVSQLVARYPLVDLPVGATAGAGQIADVSDSGFGGIPNGAGLVYSEGLLTKRRRNIAAAVAT